MMDFQKEVIQQSFIIPVLVDFWAPWCGPCKMLTPVLEEMEMEANGLWKLVKINTDEDQSLSRLFHIKSIPSVKLFVNGEVIAEFKGAHPKAFIEKWLHAALPDERKVELDKIALLLRTSKHPEALESLRRFVEENPDMNEAAALLARELALSDPFEASALLGTVQEGEEHYSLFSDILSLNQFLSFNGPDDPVSLKIKAAQIAFENKDYEAVIKLMISAVKLDKHFADDLARRVCISMFHLLGEKHPLTKKYRPEFAMALF